MKAGNNPAKPGLLCDNASWQWSRRPAAQQRDPGGAHREERQGAGFRYVCDGVLGLAGPYRRTGRVLVCEAKDPGIPHGRLIEVQRREVIV